MKTSYTPFERELLFTKIYKENINNSRHLREAACMKSQLENLFRPIRNKDTDLFAGRLEFPMIGLFTLHATSFVDEVGYCYDKNAIESALKSATAQNLISYEKVKEINDMCDFWEKENTNYKTRQRMSDEMAQCMAGDSYKTESAVAYPLYRIAGLNIDFKKLTTLGLNGLIELILKKSLATSDQDKKDMYSGMIILLDSIKDVCTKYCEEIVSLMKSSDENRKKELNMMKESLITIRDDKPQTLHDAIQLVALYMLASDSREVGRLDNYLGNFYKADLIEGRVDKELAVRMVMDFFDIVEHEMARDSRAIIGGKGRDNPAAADEFALIVLEALDRRKMAPGSDHNFHMLPQVSLRCYTGMDQRLLDKSLDILSTGRCFPILYNDDVNVGNVMRAMDVRRSVAEDYCFYGCGEYVLTAKSVGTPNALLNAAKALELALNNGIDPLTGKQIGLKTGELSTITDFDTLYKRFKAQIELGARLSAEFNELVYDVCAEECSFLLPSILMDDCIERGKALLDGGVYHLGATVESYGNITASDSLTAINEVVFKEKKYTLTEVCEAINHDFDGYDDIRKALLSADKFGNDNESADRIASMVHDDICHALRNQRNNTRLDSHLAVIINNSLNAGMGTNTGATADGRHKGIFLSNGVGAYNGQDKQGITALIHSMTKLDSSIHAGGNQNFKLSPKFFEDDNKAIKSLLSAFFALGGQQTNISVVNQEDLEDAMIHPDCHENLIVRVGGYTARFIALDKRTQKDILSRTAY